MKVWIDQDLCTGDGLCEEICPSIFHGHDDGLFYVKEAGSETPKEPTSNIIKEISDPNVRHRFGEVTNFSFQNDNNSRFYKIGGGSLGGKARGLAFAKDMISQSGINDKYKNIIVKIPRTAIIGTEEFDSFMKDNKLWDIALKEHSNKKIEKLFINSRLSMELTLKVEAFLKSCKYPLAVRSSSLLEDSQYQALSGAYSTFMLSNDQELFKDRIRELINAIKLVFASIFFHESKSWLSFVVTNNMILTSLLKSWPTTSPSVINSIFSTCW